MTHYPNIRRTHVTITRGCHARTARYDSTELTVLCRAAILSLSWTFRSTLNFDG